MAKVPDVDMVTIVHEHTQLRLKQSQDALTQELQQFKANHLVLSLLVKGGICKPEVMREANLKWGEKIMVKRSQLTKVRSLVGNMSDAGKELRDAKKRIILVRLSLDDHPHSNVKIEYLRKYTKEEEAKCRCKIKTVKVADEQEARPARFETVLVCE
jgi:hypothetical protein